MGYYFTSTLYTICKFDSYCLLGGIEQLKSEQKELLYCYLVLFLIMFVLSILLLIVAFVLGFFAEYVGTLHAVLYSVSNLYG